MTEKVSVAPWQEIRIRRTDTGWDFCRFDGRGGLNEVYGRYFFNAETFDQTIELIKRHFKVD
ncbi:hypothetical protein [Mesorhizobium sp. KR1-2]|uniref:hypothetical protein n=1 Tax=Mesorhizobium sp. KR1-2 TaxID=3156609 RepID=UPI0032B58D99